MRSLHGSQRTLPSVFFSSRQAEGAHVHVQSIWCSADILFLGSGAALSESRTPAGYGRLLYNATHVHGLRTEPQLEANGKSMFWPRAKMLGGCMCSAIHELFCELTML